MYRVIAMHFNSAGCGDPALASQIVVCVSLDACLAQWLHLLTGMPAQSSPWSFLIRCSSQAMAGRCLLTR